MNILPILLSVVLPVVAFAYLLGYAIMLQKMKRSDTKIWEKLGRPGLFINNTPVVTWNVLKFILSRRYLQLSNPVTVLLCRLLRIGLVLHIVLLVMYTFVIIVGYKV